MPELIVTYDELPYGGVMFRKGDRFIASEHDAKLLIGFGKAAMVADEPRKKRSYRRRDMKAER